MEELLQLEKLVKGEPAETEASSVGEPAAEDASSSAAQSGPPSAKKRRRFKSSCGDEQMASDEQMGRGFTPTHMTAQVDNTRIEPKSLSRSTYGNPLQPHLHSRSDVLTTWGESTRRLPGRLSTGLSQGPLQGRRLDPQFGIIVMCTGSCSFSRDTREVPECNF